MANQSKQTVSVELLEVRKKLREVCGEKGILKGELNEAKKTLLKMNAEKDSIVLQMEEVLRDVVVIEIMNNFTPNDDGKMLKS